MSTLTMPRTISGRVARLQVTGLGTAIPGVGCPSQALEPGTPAPSDWFDLATALPGRGYKRLPHGCLYLLAAARAALLDAGGRLATVPPERRAAVIGTNNVGAALLEEIDRTIVDHGAAELSPASAAFVSMSNFASRLAIEHQLNGFSLTANSPAVAGLEALQIAARALTANRATAVLVGAVEDKPLEGEHTYDGADIGAAVLVCEPVGASKTPSSASYGTCSAHSVFLNPTGADTASALEPLWEVLNQTGALPEQIDTVLDDSAVGRAVAAWLADRVPANRIVAIHAETDAGSLTAMRRVLGRLAANPSQTTRYAVLTASALGGVSLADIEARPRARTPQPQAQPQP